MDYHLFMLGLNLIHVSKKCHMCKILPRRRQGTVYLYHIVDVDAADDQYDPTSLVFSNGELLT